MSLLPDHLRSFAHEKMARYHREASAWRWGVESARFTPPLELRVGSVERTLPHDPARQEQPTFDL